MSLMVQSQPNLPDIAFQGALAPQRVTTDLQAQITEAVIQLVKQLLDDLMKAPPATPGMDSQQDPAAGQFAGGAPCQPGGAQSQADTGQPQPDTAKPPLFDVRQRTQAETGAGPSQPDATSPASPGARPGVEAAKADAPADAGKGPADMPSRLWQHCVDTGQKTGVDPFVLAAQMKKESQFGNGLAGSPSAADGLMQVEPGTRQAYAAQFEAKMGHAYDHGDAKDQVAMAGAILADKGGGITNMLQKYNGGDNWAPGATDSYGRVIKADEYAAAVIASAEQMKTPAG